MTLQTCILTRKDPNRDVLRAICSLEKRAEKMLTLSVALMSVNFFFHSKIEFIFSFPFFIISFVFYFLTFVKRPTLLNREIPREKLYTLFQSGAYKPEEISKINEIDDIYRKKFFESYDRKKSYIKRAHTGFFGLMITTTIVFGLENFLPDFFSDKTRSILLFIILILVSMIFYLNFFYSETRQFKIRKNEQS